jgi:coenzyme F420-reducing hydrogenase beta subunit
MKIENLQNQCTGCSACKSICPTQCITMELDSEGFYYPNINHDNCIECRLCEKVCHCITKKETITHKKSYYGWNKDTEKRLKSTSGGAFIALAEMVISKGGLVFGAAFDNEKRELIHTSTDHVELEKLLKSKYVESNLLNVFTEVQESINEGRTVLFCGTPCQASGLRRFIKDPQSLLLICDFICHGVPCSKFLKEHLDKLCKNEKLLEIDFRPKEKGWVGNTNIRTRTRTRTRYYVYDSFYSGFLKHNAYLRRSCYDCKFAETHVSDITLGDFWGYKNYDPEIGDEKGVSLIVVNNDRGKEAIKVITDSFELHKIDNKYSDYAFVRRDYSVYWKTRNEFYKLYQQYGFEKAAKKTYMRGVFWRYALHIFKQHIKKIIGRK